MARQLIAWRFVGTVLVLGIDLGTASVKVGAVNEDGLLQACEARPYPVRHPTPLAAESSPTEWRDAVVAGVREVIRHVPPAHVEGIGLSGQMHGVVLADAHCAPLRPAIVWADQRSRSELGIFRGLDRDLRSRLANPIVDGMAGVILRWVSAHEPQTWFRTRWALQPKDWLRAWLTGVVATEPSDASATLLWDLPGERWFTEVLDAVDLPSAVLPPVVASTDVVGALRPDVAADLGLRPGTPVVAGAADTAAALEGTALPPGAVQLSLGSGAQVVALTDALPPLFANARPPAGSRRLTHTYRTAQPSGWYAMAAVRNAGLALEWVRSLFAIDWATFSGEAFTVPSGAGGVRFVPHLTAERIPPAFPDIDVEGSGGGAWLGVSSDHRRAHLLRAALEGVAFAVADAVDALRARGHEASGVRLLGGGSTDMRWRQLLADVVSRPLVAVETPQASVLGAARLAAASLGHTLPAPADTLRVVAEPGSDAARYQQLRIYRSVGSGKG